MTRLEEVIGIEVVCGGKLLAVGRDDLVVELIVVGVCYDNPVVLRAVDAVVADIGVPVVIRSSMADTVDSGTHGRSGKRAGAVIYGQGFIGGGGRDGDGIGCGDILAGLDKICLDVISCPALGACPVPGGIVCGGKIG